MIHYNEIHELLQTQVELGELSVTEATLVDDIAFIGGGNDSPYYLATEGSKGNGKKKKEPEHLVQNIRALSKEYRGLCSQFKKEIKRGEYKSALSTIKHAKQLLQKIKRVVYTSEILEFGTLRVISLIITGMGSMAVLGTSNQLHEINKQIEDIDNEKSVVDRGLSPLVMTQSETGSRTDTLEQIKKNEQMDRAYRKKPLKAAGDDVSKTLGASLAITGGAIASSVALSKGKKVILKLIDSKIAKLAKTEKTVRDLLSRAQR